MPVSDYPNGFEDGVIVRGVPVHNVIPAKVAWVGNNTALLQGERGASDGNKGTYLSPLSTLDAAYNQVGADGVIFVRPNHALSIANATTLVMDSANVQIIGLGVGEDRPIITFATAAAAAIPVSGANNRISNIVFKCNIASQNHMLDVKATDLVVDHCDFREGTATGLSFITADTADNDSDRLQVINCNFYAPTAGNMDAAIQLAKDFKSVRLLGNNIHGDFDNAAIEIPAGGNAQIDLMIGNCRVANLQTGIHAIELNGTGNSGKIYDTYCEGDTLGTIVDAGGLEMFNVFEHSGADQSQANPAGTALDTAENFIGVDDSNNVVATTNVAANEDGSILERLEQLQEAVNKGTGTALAANKSLVDALGTDGATLADDAVSIVGILGVDDSNNAFASTNVAANRDGSILERLEALASAPDGTGHYLYVTKSLTSSAVLTTGVDVTGVSSGGGLEMVHLSVMTDATGLAAGTLFTLETNNANGKLVFATEAVADMGATATETMGVSTNTFDAGSFLPILESGKKIVAKCTVANCTGTGVAVVHMVFRRLANAATVAAA